MMFDRADVQARWERYRKLWRRWNETAAYLEDFPDDPDADELADRMLQGAREWGAFGDELAEWLGVAPKRLVGLLESELRA